MLADRLEECVAEGWVNVECQFSLVKQSSDAKRAMMSSARKLFVILFTMVKSNSAFDEQKRLSRLVHNLPS